LTDRSESYKKQLKVSVYGKEKNNRD